MVKKSASLRIAIIFPVMLLFIITAFLLSYFEYQALDEQRVSNALTRSEIITYSVRYTAEVAGLSSELNRTVQALSTESNVKTISVIDLNADHIVASNRFKWRNKKIADVSLDDHKLDAINQYKSGFNGDINLLQQDNTTYTFASRFIVPDTEAQRGIKSYVVFVDLDTQYELAKIRRLMIIVTFAELGAALAIVILIYLLLSKLVFKPLKSIQQSINHRAENFQTVEVKVHRRDEIGLLAETFNEMISQEERSRSDIQAREQELQLIFDNVPVRIWYKDDQNKILRLNKRAAESMGMAVADAEGKNTYDLFPEMAKKYHDDDLQVIQSGIPKLDIVEKYTPLRGSEGWVRTDKVPYNSVDGSLAGVFVVSQDITVFKQAEQKLRESQKRLQLVIDATQDGIWDWPNMDEDKEYWSPRWKALLGYKDHDIEASASKFFSLLHPEDIAKTEKAVEDHIKDGAPFDVEYRLKTKDGSYRWFQGKGKMTVDSDTGNRRMSGSITDIHERKNTEEKLKEYTLELERSNRDLDEFAYIASHDLKSPLRGIDQLASWISEDLKEIADAETQGNLYLLRNRVQRMEQLLTDLLIYSRVGRTDEAFSNVNIREMVEDVFELSSPPPGFKLKLSDTLPEIYTMAVPLEQVLRNLVGNAIKHHQSDTGNIMVECNDNMDDDFVEFKVVDDGPGIDEKYHNLVFKMFKSLKSRDDLEGSGMGLALIKKIVETYGGNIQLKSALGKGTTFIFTWPKYQHDESQTQ